MPPPAPNQEHVGSLAPSQHSYNGNDYIINHGRDQNLNFGGTMYINNPSAALPNYIQEALIKIQYSYRHDSQARFPQPKCSEGTRKVILSDLMGWACSDLSPEIAGVCWLRGSAGTGKSAIAQTIAEASEGKNLLATFFFSRSDPNRNTSRYLALAMADAIITTIPSLQHTILQKVNNRREILHATLDAQFKALVIEPLLEWRDHIQSSQSIHPTIAISRPQLVIIDGLDECLDITEQQQVLSLVLLAMGHKLPVRFFICSCPEPQIQGRFNQENLSQFTKFMSLNGDPNANSDIAIMLCTEFRRIRNSERCKHIVFPDPWPSQWDLQRLVDKSSGQFIYPATILKFIDHQDYHPYIQLQYILHSTSSEPEVYDAPRYHDLDVLYKQILTSASRNPRRLLHVLATALTLKAVHYNLYSGSIASSTGN
ncbi:hypothetical protein L218DRAFT_1009307 [Marasmius fiardii PR-910]|nr:hypothetical protein L218DRAFT_1009307 [Marasmius fiardii PR-910]